ncbi:MAG: drug/metabolite transporter (DMT)-like permease [Chlamydiales bacterium]|jgi:drug/metabolite transporter (DMT)-like permease
MLIKDLLGIILLASLWGPTFLFTKIIVEEIHPLTLSFLRCALGSLSLAIVLWFKKTEMRPLLKHWKKFAISGILGNALPFVFCSYGEVYVDSATAGIFEGTIPIFTLIFTYLFMPSQKLTRGQVYGVVLGFIGLLVIFAPGVSSSNFFTFNDELLGKVYLLSMACCFAASFVYAKKYCASFPPLQGVFFQLFYSALFLLPTLAFVGNHTLLTLPSTHVVLSTLWLGSIGTASSWCLYFFLLKRVSAAEVSLATYLCPIFAIALGMAFLGEEPSNNLYFGTLLIILALGFATGKVKKEATSTL